MDRLQIWLCCRLQHMHEVYTSSNNYKIKLFGMLQPHSAHGESISKCLTVPTSAEDYHTLSMHSGAQPAPNNPFSCPHSLVEASFGLECLCVVFFSISALTHTSSLAISCNALPSTSKCSYIEPDRSGGLLEVGFGHSHSSAALFSLYCACKLPVNLW